MRHDDTAFPLDEACAFGMTDVGRKRETNQDQFLIAQLNKSMLVSSTSLPMHQQSRLYGSVQGQLCLVADGMGGHAAGEKASSLAIDDLVTQLLNSVHWFFQVDQDSEDDFIDDLKELLKNAHARILKESSRNMDQRGMGTTLTMAHIMWPRMYVVHVGDSRCYLIRDGKCEQLTTDHTLARRLVETGGLRPEEEAGSRWSNVLWNVLGGQGETELIAEVHRADLQPGDTVLLCSDGLYRYLDCKQFADAVGSSDDLPAICAQLIDRANEAGGEDNITVVIAKPQPAQPDRPSSSYDLQSLAGQRTQRDDLDDTWPGPDEETDDDLPDTYPG